VSWSLVREVRTNMKELFSLDIVKISRSQNNVAQVLKPSLCGCYTLLSSYYIDTQSSCVFEKKKM